MPKERGSEFANHALGLGAFAGLLYIAFSAHSLSKLQRKSIVEERDQNSCHAPFPHDCNQDNFRIEVHHLPLRSILTHLGLNIGKIPELFLSVCRAGHDNIHPDRVWTRQHYHPLKREGIDAFEELQEWRKGMLGQGWVYWDNQHDDRIVDAATKRTDRAMSKRDWQYTKYLERFPPDEARDILHTVVEHYSDQPAINNESIGHMLTQFLVEKYGWAISKILGNGNGNGHRKYW